MVYNDAKNKDLAVFLMSCCCSMLWLHSDGLQRCKKTRIWQYFLWVVAVPCCGCIVMAFNDAKTRIWQYFSWVTAAPWFGCIVMAYNDAKQTWIWQYFSWDIAALCSGFIVMASYDAKQTMVCQYYSWVIAAPCCRYIVMAYSIQNKQGIGSITHELLLLPVVGT